MIGLKTLNDPGNFLTNKTKKIRVKAFNPSKITAEPKYNVKISIELKILRFEIFIKPESKKPSIKNAKAKIDATRSAVSVLVSFTKTSVC